jgi:hypothetical protein
MSRQMEVERQHFENYRITEHAAREPGAGEIKLKIDFFAFTANNLTYAAAGDALGYWQFFPTLATEGDGWGVIPVWGFADVVESHAGGVTIGDRLYGYFPPGDTLVIKPVNVKEAALYDGSEHRSKLPPLYNRYLRVPKAADEAGRQMEIAQALLGPLYGTSFCLFDQLRNNAWYGAEQIIIISASSKTSLGLAYGLADTDNAPAIIGLTSAGNVDFVNGLGIYDEAIAYADVASLSQCPTVVVDMAGNSALAASLEAQLGDELNYYISVGLTHWDQNSGGLGKRNERHEMFFAPSYMLERSTALPPGEFASQAQAYVAKASMSSLAWLDLSILNGLGALAAVYPDACAGRIPPTRGLICQM